MLIFKLFARSSIKQKGPESLQPSELFVMCSNIWSRLPWPWRYYKVNQQLNFKTEHNFKTLCYAEANSCFPCLHRSRWHIFHHLPLQYWQEICVIMCLQKRILHMVKIGFLYLLKAMMHVQWIHACLCPSISVPLWCLFSYHLIWVYILQAAGKVSFRIVLHDLWHSAAALTRDTDRG